MTARDEPQATYEMQNLLIAMDAAMSVVDPPVTTFTVEGERYKLTLERIDKETRA